MIVSMVHPLHEVDILRGIQVHLTHGEHPDIAPRVVQQTGLVIRFVAFDPDWSDFENFKDCRSKRLWTVLNGLVEFIGLGTAD